MALPADDQLKLLAKMKAGLRYTDAEVAAYFEVTPRTIQRWLRESAYGEAVRLFKEEQRDDAKAHLSGLAGDIVSTMYSLMMNDRISALVRFNAGKTLGEWVGLADLKEEKPEDNREEAMELLRRLALDKPSPIYLPPPGAGGRLPDEFVDGEIVVESSTTDPENYESGDRSDLVAELAAAKMKFDDDTPLDS